MTVKGTKFPHRKIHGKRHNKIDHVSTDKRRQSNTVDSRSFRRSDNDIDHYLVVSKLREELSLSK